MEYPVVGELDDRVRLRLAEDTVLICEEYNVEQAFLDVPDAFSLRLGSESAAADIIKKYPPRTPFELYIGDAIRFTGAVDGYTVDYDADSGTTVTLEGRDGLGELVSSFVKKEESFKETSYTELVKHALRETGLSDAADNLQFADLDSRRKSAKAPSIEELDPNATAEIVEREAGDGAKYRTIKVKLGELWYEFVKRNLDRAGLFLWTNSAGSFVLGRPSPKQTPAYKIVVHHDDDGTLGKSNVLRARYVNRTEHRYSHARVYGRYGGKKWGPAKAKGGFTDQEMVDLGYDRELTLHDINVSTQDEAEFYASRKISESRRHGYFLQYTVAGHTTESITGDGRSVWTPNTVVSVDDTINGVNGNFWIDKCEYHVSATGGTLTTLTMMRPEDVLFGDIGNND